MASRAQLTTATSNDGGVSSFSTDLSLSSRTLFESSTDALSVLDQDGVILEVNTRWETILRLPRVAIVGRHIRDFAAPGHADDNVAIYRQAIGESRSAVRIFPIARSDGKVVYVEVSFVNMTMEGRSVVLAVGRDITVLRETIAALEESERRYRSLVQSIPDVVWSVDRDARADFVSENVLRVLGYRPQEALARYNDDPKSCCHPDDLVALCEAFERMMRTGEPLDLEHRLRHKSGSWVWVHTRGRRVSTGRGETVRVEGVSTDLTNRRKLEAQLLRSQRLEAVGQLTGGVAHDFNNVLSVILANAHFVLDALPPEHAGRADVEEIRRAADRAASLTHQLLAFSRQQVMVASDFDLNEVVDGMKEMLRRVISEDIEVSIERSESSALVHADRGQIEQVIMNLCVNARDAMPDGGALTIHTDCVELTPDSDDATIPAGSYVRLSVCDTGTGMSEAVKQQIFEPFFTTKGPTRGTGLGLSTCYGIAKQSGGFIEVETAPGNGSTFHVYLPRAACEQRSVRPAAKHQASERGYETVLLVEDDAGLRRALQRALGAAGYTVLAAGTATDALALFGEAADRIDLVLSDVVLPDESGIHVVERIHEVSPSTKAMLMSGHTDHALLMNHTLRVGTGFMQKPFALHALGDRIRETLDAHASKSELAEA